ncbi:MAG: hypothetical protein A2V65_04855 [Deltaproteobacteria bacterium RBG_13_49_15]|nr:MAG: hypothetical protein A2V65_04855 [Deltaproteobacteria bacterium RBG_13_49_15]
MPDQVRHDENLSGLFRHSGEPRIGSRAGAGIYNILEVLDSGFHRNDKFGIIQRSHSMKIEIEHRRVY